MQICPMGISFLEAKKYGAQYLALLIAKAGGGLPADYPLRRSIYLPGTSSPA
jgi:hypothetical protein